MAKCLETGLPLVALRSLNMQGSISRATRRIRSCFAIRGPQAAYRTDVAADALTIADGRRSQRPENPPPLRHDHCALMPLCQLLRAGVPWMAHKHHPVSGGSRLLVQVSRPSPDENDGALSWPFAFPRRDARNRREPVGQGDRRGT